MPEEENLNDEEKALSWTGLATGGAYVAASLQQLQELNKISAEIKEVRDNEIAPIFSPTVESEIGKPLEFIQHYLARPDGTRERAKSANQPTQINGGGAIEKRCNPTALKFYDVFKSGLSVGTNKLAEVSPIATMIAGGILVALGTGGAIVAQRHYNPLVPYAAWAGSLGASMVYSGANVKMNQRKGELDGYRCVTNARYLLEKIRTERVQLSAGGTKVVNFTAPTNDDKEIIKQALFCVYQLAHGSDKVRDLTSSYNAASITALWDHITFDPDNKLSLQTCNHLNAGSPTNWKIPANKDSLYNTYCDFIRRTNALTPPQGNLDVYDHIRDQIAGMKTQVDDLHEIVVDPATGHHLRTDLVTEKARIAALEASRAQLQTETDALNALTTTGVNSNAELARRIEECAETVAGHTTRIDGQHNILIGEQGNTTLATQIHDLRADVNTINREAGGLNVKIGTVGTELEQVTTRVQALETAARAT